MLKRDYSANVLRIWDLESKLTALSDQEIRLELEKFPIYDHLSAEKMSPHFLKLAKATKADKRLSDICKPNGEKFDSDGERNNYIRDNYGSIYRIPENRTALEPDCIESFLGPEMCNSDTVQNSKLSVEDRDRLESPLTIEELDKAVKQSKSNTACGSDGIGNKFLKKFWNLIRKPLFHYATTAFQEGRLSDSFKVASIKLIPKKGDHTQLTNWRPISLLNCSYKIIAKAMDNRLGSVTDRILSRAQKGFAANRFIQEVLINSIEYIAGCKAEGKEEVVLTIDQHKAFDSTRHDFLTLAYKFFGFGENFIKNA